LGEQAPLALREIQGGKKRLDLGRVQFLEVSLVLFEPPNFGIATLKS
jgi:hypothetical protein